MARIGPSLDVLSCQMKKYFLLGSIIFGALSIASPASASQTDYFTEGVTSGSSSYEAVTGAICTHGAGTITVHQWTSSPNSTGLYKIVNYYTGNSTYSFLIPDGYSFSVPGIIAGTHQLWVRRETPKDTNGSFSPGSGVTTFSGAYVCPN
jgi:hypothetical protein